MITPVREEGITTVYTISWKDNLIIEIDEDNQKAVRFVEDYYSYYVD